jgi:hypothetical protein
MTTRLPERTSSMKPVSHSLTPSLAHPLTHSLIVICCYVEWAPLFVSALLFAHSQDMQVGLASTLATAGSVW